MADVAISALPAADDAENATFPATQGGVTRKVTTTQIRSGLSVTGHSHVASGVAFTPAGGIAASNVQAALEELDTEKDANPAAVSEAEALAGTETALRSWSPWHVALAAAEHGGGGGGSPGVGATSFEELSGSAEFNQLPIYGREYLTPSDDNAIDVTLIAGHLRTGSGWDATYTHTFSGGPAEGQYFIFSNNSGHTQDVVDDGGETPNTLELPSSPYAIPHATWVLFRYDSVNGRMAPDQSGHIGLRVNGNNVNVDGVTLQGPVLKAYGETSPSASVDGSVTRDFADGNVHRLTLTGNVTALAISNPPASGTIGTFTIKIIQDGSGGHTWAHPTGIVWPGGAAPTLTTGAGDVSWITYVTDDAGTTWYGFEGGVDFS